MTTLEVERPVVLRQRRAGADGRLLLLHGLANSATVWQGFTEHDTGFATWAADLPWRGEGVAGWSQRGDLAGWVAEAIASVPGDGPLTVVAHSFSANLLLALLDREPALVGDLASVVLVSPFYRSAPERFEWTDISRYLNDFHTIMEDGIRAQGGQRLSPAVRRELALRVRDLVGPYGWTRFFQTYLDTPWLRLDRLDLPVLVLSGENDFAALPGEARALAAALPDARVRVLPDCGHFLMAERPERFAAEITRFVHPLSVGETTR
ncbi:alpha/beta fold hydrolase [Actinokineospora soli]|uniref:Alpha/beta fold hydrolase n=1 Tax=Actinokineospora soli TaxID=1048753 RepID=A0ABW2TV89_9PSEU